MRSPASQTIAILSPFLRGNKGHGGITPWLINLANGLSDRGLTIELLVNARRHSELSHPKLNPKIKITNLGRRKPIAFWHLLRYLRKHPPAALLTAGHRYNNMGYWAKRATQVPVYLSMHENYSVSGQGLSPKRQRERIAQITDQLAHCDGVIAVSQGVADDLINHGLPQNKCHIIHNPITHPGLSEQARQPVTHPWYTKKRDAPLIVAAGRLEPQKDYPTLIQAFSLVKHKIPNARLLILGEGSQRASLQTQIKKQQLNDSIQLAGHVENPFAYMSNADLFVLSSAWEGFGNVLVEAMATGTPVVSTDCPSGPSEILDQGRYGRLTPVGDTEALAVAILETLESPLPPETLIARSHEFDITRAAEKYHHVLLGEN